MLGIEPASFPSSSFDRLAKKEEEKKRRMAQWAKDIKIETGKESERANGASGKIGKIVTSKRCPGENFAFRNLRISRVFSKFDGGFNYFEIVKKTEQLQIPCTSANAED